MQQKLSSTRILSNRSPQFIVTRRTAPPVLMHEQNLDAVEARTTKERNACRGNLQAYQLRGIHCRKDAVANMTSRSMALVGQTHQ
jgi:hypothetical protein